MLLAERANIREEREELRSREDQLEREREGLEDQRRAFEAQVCSPCVAPPLSHSPGPPLSAVALPLRWCPVLFLSSSASSLSPPYRRLADAALRLCLLPLPGSCSRSSGLCSSGTAAHHSRRSRSRNRRRRCRRQRTQQTAMHRGTRRIR